MLPMLEDEAKEKQKASGGDRKSEEYIQSNKSVVELVPQPIHTDLGLPEISVKSPTPAPYIPPAPTGQSINRCLAVWVDWYAPDIACGEMISSQAIYLLLPPGKPISLDDKPAGELVIDWF